MKQEDLCPGKAPQVWVSTDDPEFHGFFMFDPFPKKRVKRIRMRCELCGRRVWSSVRVYHDGGELVHLIPPHKPKGWWKKKKKKRSGDGIGIHISLRN